MKHTVQLFNRTLGITSAAALAFASVAWADHHAKDESTSHPASDQAAQSAASTALPETGSQTASSTDPHAAKFLREASLDNEMEIAMGKLGVERAQNSELKKFAEQLRKDHTKARTKLASLAQQHGVSVDQEKAKEHKELTKLQKLSGSEFDREFTLAALKEHQKDVAKYKKAVQQVQAAEVRQFAQQTLPTLQQHLSHAAQVAQTVGIDQSTISTYTRPGTSAVGGSTETGEESDTDSSKSGEASDNKNHQGHGASQLKDSESSSEK